MKCENPGIIDYNNYIYVFPYIKDYNNIFKMNLEKNQPEWETIKYSINEGYIKKGMAIIPNENNLYLLGGHDDKGDYSDWDKLIWGEGRQCSDPQHLYGASRQ